MSENADEWRWADAEGAVSTVDTWELTSSLSTGSLPPYTLVWRRGWAEWLPACQVAELSTAIPAGQAEPPVQPELTDLDEPPPPPVDRYRAYKPPVSERWYGSARRSDRRSRGIPPPPAQQRPPMPTLVEPHAPSTATLRPPGAVPPPPRTVPSRTALEESELQPPASVTTPLPDVAIRELEQEAERAAHHGGSSAQPSTESQGGALSSTLNSAQATPFAKDDSRAAPTAQPRLTVAIVALASVAVVLAATIVFLMRDKMKPQLVVTPGAPSARPKSEQCLLVHPAERLAPSIVISVPPYLAVAPHGARIAVGFAAASEVAAGITVDPRTLSVRHVFSQRVSSPLAGVAPMTKNGHLGFAVDTRDAPLGDAHTLDTEPPVTLGTSDAGFVRQVGHAAPEPVWPGVTGAAMTQVRVAATPDGSHIVTFRRGGQSGSVIVGWLGPHGKRKSALQRIEPEGRYVGTPVVAANDRAILVAFAARSQKDAYWGIQLATSPLGKLPARSHPMPIVPGGPGIETMSPAVAAMSEGRWLLQWTEGSRGEHVVRVQVLSPDLTPIGDAVTVSAKDANAGQGVVWVQGKTAISFYLVSTGNGHELWGAAFQCP